MTRVNGLPKHVYPSGNGFIAVVRHKNKRKYLGMFDTPEEAHEIAVAFRKEYPVENKRRVQWKPGDPAE